MADNQNTTQNDFILSLIGTLDEATTRSNVQNALDKISTSVSLKSNKTKNKITIFDKTQLEKDGVAYLNSAKDIESQVSEIFKNLGTDFTIKKTFADDGSVSKFVATIYEGTKAIQTLNFEAAKFTDKTSGFRQVGGTSTTEKIALREIELIKSENEQINIQEILLGRLSQAKQQLNDGSIPADSIRLNKINEEIKLLESQIKEVDFSKVGYEIKSNFDIATKSILEAAEAEYKLHNVMMDGKTGVFNIPVLEKEGISFYDNTVGVVERVKKELESKGYTPKISILGRDSEGNVTSFTAQIKNASGVVDNLNYSLVQLTDGYKTFEGFMSSYGKQIDNTSEQSAKSYQKQIKELDKVSEKVKDVKRQYQDGFLNDNSIKAFDYSVREVTDEIERLRAKAGQITDEEMTNLNKLTKGLKTTASMLSDNETQQKAVTEAYNKQSKSIAELELRLEGIRNKAFIGKGALTNESQIKEMNSDLREATDLIKSLKSNRGDNNILSQTELDAVDLKLKDINQNLSVFKEIDALAKQDKNSVESQTKALNSLDQKLKDIRSKYSRGNNQLFDLKNVRDIEYLIQKAEEEIVRLQSKVGKVSAEEAMSLQNRLTTIQRIASERLDIEKTERKNLSDAEKTAQAYEKQKYNLASLKQDVQKLSDSVLKGKNPLVDENNISNAQSKIKSLNDFIDGLYTKHNKGDIISDDAFSRFDLKLKEVNQDLKNIKDDESLQKSLAGNIESQTDALNKYDQKLKDIVQKYSSGGNQLFNESNIKNFRLEVLSIENELSRLGDKLGYITAEESRNLSNMFSNLQRTANGFVDMERSEQKENAIAEKNNKTYEDQSIKLLKLEQSIRAIVDSSLSGSKQLLDVNNIDYVEGKLNSINTFINGMYSGHNAGKIIPDNIFAKVDVQIKELNQDISVLRDIENIAKNAESKLTSLSNVEQKLLSFQSKFLDGSKIATPSYITDISDKISNIILEIERLKLKSDNITESESRNLSIMISSLQREADEYSKIDAAHQKNEANLQKQKKDLSDITMQLQAISRTTLSPKAAGKLTDSSHIQSVTNDYNTLLLMVNNLKNAVNNGKIIDVETMQRASNLFAKLNQDINVFKQEETLIKNATKSMQSQLTTLNNFEQKVLNLRADYFGDNSPSKLIDTNNISQVDAALNGVIETINRMRETIGTNNEETYRSLTNQFNAAVRLADGYKEAESAQKQYDKSLSTQAKDLKNIYNQLELINRTVLSPNANSNLKDSSHLVTVRNQYSDLIQLVYRLDKEVSSGKVVNAEDLQRANDLLSKMQINIKVFKDEETLVKNATKSMESQLNTLNNFEQKTNKLRANYLTQNGSSTLIDTNHIKAVETEIGNLTSKIESMRNTTDTNNEASYRALLNQYNALELLASGYANLEKSETKNEESLRKQANTLADYKRGINDLYNLNIDQSSKGSLKNQNNINNIANTILQLNTELKNMQQISSSGQIVPVDQMDRFVALYKDLNSQITLARSQEGLSALNEKDMQSQINKFAEMERALERFRAKYYGYSSNTRLSDQMHLDDTTNKLQVLDNMLNMFKNNAGNITDAQINEYKNLENELNITADGYAKLEAIQKKETQTVDDQKYILDAYYLELKKIRETTLNPNSVFSLTESDNIQKITDNVTKLEQKYQDLRAKNNSGNLINKNELKETDLILKELQQDINIIGKEDASSQKFDANIIRTKTNLINLIAQLERTGKLEGNIKVETAKLVSEFNNIKTPQELDNFNARLKQFDVQVQNLLKDEQALATNNQVQQKLQILSSQVNGYMQQNSRAAVMFKSDFDKLRQGIENARSPEELAKLQNDFKLLQQNINNAGQAGLTFGQRISGAVKKFMMWTGMTNVVMYLVRSIKQMVTNVKELDSAMISLKKVTNETDVAYKNMFDSAVEKAKELNTSVKNIIDSTAEFAKLGFSTEQAQGLAEVANVYANVGELDISSATESLVSTINGFKDLNADDAWKIIDEFNNVGRIVA